MFCVGFIQPPRVAWPNWAGQTKHALITSEQCSKLDRAFVSRCNHVAMRGNKSQVRRGNEPNKHASTREMSTSLQIAFFCNISLPSEVDLLPTPVLLRGAELYLPFPWRALQLTRTLWQPFAVVWVIWTSLTTWISMLLRSHCWSIYNHPPSFMLVKALSGKPLQVLVWITYTAAVNWSVSMWTQHPFNMKPQVRLHLPSRCARSLTSAASNAILINFHWTNGLSHQVFRKLERPHLYARSGTCGLSSLNSTLTVSVAETTHGIVTSRMVGALRD